MSKDADSCPVYESCEDQRRKKGAMGKFSVSALDRFETGRQAVVTVKPRVPARRRGGAEAGQWQRPGSGASRTHWPGVGGHRSGAVTEVQPLFKAALRGRGVPT